MMKIRLRIIRPRVIFTERLGGVISIRASLVSVREGMVPFGSSSLRVSSGSLVPRKVSRAL